jgi:hypothetical protein
MLIPSNIVVMNSNHVKDLKNDIHKFNFIQLSMLDMRFYFHFRNVKHCEAIHFLKWLDIMCGMKIYELCDFTIFV